MLAVCWLSYEECRLYVGSLAVFGSRLEDAGSVWFLSGRCWLCLVLVWRMLAVFGSRLEDAGCVWLLYEGCVFGSRLEDAGCKLALVCGMLGVSWFSSGRCWLCLASAVF